MEKTKSKKDGEEMREQVEAEEKDRKRKRRWVRMASKKG